MNFLDLCVGKIPFTIETFWNKNLSIEKFFATMTLRNIDLSLRKLIMPQVTPKETLYQDATWFQNALTDIAS